MVFAAHVEQFHNYLPGFRYKGNMIIQYHVLFRMHLSQNVTAQFRTMTTHKYSGEITSNERREGSIESGVLSMACSAEPLRNNTCIRYSLRKNINRIGLQVVSIA